MALDLRRPLTFQGTDPPAGSNGSMHGYASGLSTLFYTQVQSWVRIPPHAQRFYMNYKRMPSYPNWQRSTAQNREVMGSNPIGGTGLIGFDRLRYRLCVP